MCVLVRDVAKQRHPARVHSLPTDRQARRATRSATRHAADGPVGELELRSDLVAADALERALDREQSLLIAPAGRH